MIAGDRGSQIADRRRSQREAHCARGKIAANIDRKHRGGNFAASKFISSFSPEATTSSASKPKETSDKNLGLSTHW